MDFEKHDSEDRNLHSLLRLALEAEALEESAVVSRLRLTAGSARPQRKWLLPLAGVMSAAAAVVAVVTVVMPGFKPTAVGPAIGATAHGGRRNTPVLPESTTDKVPIIATGDPDPHKGFENPLQPDGLLTNGPAPESSVVLAFFQGLDGRCSCLHIQKEDWNQAQLAGKDGSQLLDVAFHSSCSQPSPKVLIVGIAGRPDSLPGPEAAEALAVSLSKTPMNSTADLQRRAYEVMTELPAGTTVVTESFGHNRSFPIEPAKWTTR